MPTKARKTWAQQLQQNHSVTIAMSCAIVGLSRCAYYYQPNRTYRTEVLDLYLFNNLAQARRITEEWLMIYNTERPHEALNNMTPIEYKTLKQAA